jgi:hypothetical protein
LFKYNTWQNNKQPLIHNNYVMPFLVFVKVYYYVNNNNNGKRKYSNITCMYIVTCHTFSCNTANTTYVRWDTTNISNYIVYVLTVCSVMVLPQLLYVYKNIKKTESQVYTQQSNACTHHVVCLHKPVFTSIVTCCTIGVQRFVLINTR